VHYDAISVILTNKGTKSLTIFKHYSCDPNNNFGHLLVKIKQIKCPYISKFTRL